MTIDWTSPGPHDEIMDGLLATFAPAVASLQACKNDGCDWGFEGPGNQEFSAFEITPLSLTVGTNPLSQGGSLAWVTLDLSHRRKRG